MFLLGRSWRRRYISQQGPQQVPIHEDEVAGVESSRSVRLDIPIVLTFCLWLEEPPVPTMVTMAGDGRE